MNHVLLENMGERMKKCSFKNIFFFNFAARAQWRALSVLEGGNEDTLGLMNHFLLENMRE